MNQLEKFIKTGRIPHALLFAGGTKKEREEKALHFAMDITLGEKLDVHHFRPEGKVGMHGIDSIRNLIYQVSLYPNRSKRQVFILHDAERMLPTSSNALLKTLEEPISHSVLILLTEKKEKILSTIVSRCHPFFLPITPQERTPLQEEFLALFIKKSSFNEIETFVDGIEKRKKKWEKELLQELPKDLPAQQRERLEKEIEGVVSLKFKEEALSLFECIYFWSYEQFLMKLQKAPQMSTRSFSSVEQAIKKGILGLERSISLQTLLETLLLQ